MTRPLRTRPSQSAGFDTGAFSAIVGTALSLGLVMHNPRTNGAGVIRQERRYFSAFRDAACVAVRPRRKWLCPLRSNFRRKFAPDSIHARECDGSGGVRLPELGGLAMGRVYPQDSKQEVLDRQAGPDEPPLRVERAETDECSDGVLSLLEENARLRGLVVKLTEIILRSVADRGKRRTAAGARRYESLLYLPALQRGLRS